MYSVEVEATGFRKVVRSGVELNVEDRVEIELRLEVGQLAAA
jgi:hypothetical protein